MSDASSDEYRAYASHLDDVPNLRRFLGRYAERVGYTAGAHLPEPAAFASRLNIAEDNLAAITA